VKLPAMSLDRARLNVILGTTAFVLLIWWAYPNQLTPVLAQEAKLYYYPLSIWEDVLYFVLAMLPAFWMPTDIKKPSQFMWWILYTTVAIPTCVCGPRVMPSRDSVLPFVLLVTFCMLVLLPVSSFKPLKLPRISVPPVVLWTGATMFVLVTFAALIAFYGMPSALPGLGDIKSLRAAFKEKSQDVPVLVGYLFRWTGSVANPLFMAFGLVRRKPILFFLGAAGEVGLFIITSLRSYNMAPLIILGVGLWILKSKGKNAPGFIWGFTGLAAVQSLWLCFNTLAPLPLIFYSRFLFNGGQASAHYYEFFTTHPPALMGNSFFTSWLLHSPYDIEVGKVIGREYFISGTSSTTTNATAHLWADAFGNFLVPGVFAATLVAAMIMWAIDSAYEGIDWQIAVLMMVMISLSINGQGIHTSLLTGGVVPMIILGLIGRRSLKPYFKQPKKKRPKLEALPSQLSPQDA
jgi:hypothetical protein